MKTLSKTKTDKYDKILSKSNVFVESEKLSKEEKQEFKAHAIKKAVKLGKYKI